MKSIPLVVAALSAVSLLSACGGGGGGGSAGSGLVSGTLANQYTNFSRDFSADPNLASLTPNSTVNGLSTSARYSGIANFNLGDVAYLGSANMTVDFARDTFSGGANGFERYYSTIASASNGSRVSGSVSMSGRLTGDNESFTDGLTGSGSGSIEGNRVEFTMDGNVTGLRGEGAILYFDRTNGRGGGVGYLTR